MKRSNIILQLIFLAGCLAFPSEGFADSTSVTQTTVSDAQAATSNGEWGSSRLQANDRVIIQAPELNSAAGSYGVCKSVLSSDSRDIFVPWNSPLEWSDFLKGIGIGSLKNYSISSCCAPLTASVCGTDTGVQMGYRTIGTVLDSKLKTGKPLDATLRAKYNLDPTVIQHYGAQGDIYGPVYASAATNNSAIDYEVTYVCSGATWIKTHEIGSCVPLDGACNSPGIMKTLPDDTSTLCGTGSIINNLTANANGWTWECDGTPGRSNAQCAAYINPPTDGKCGPYAVPDDPATSLATLQSMNPSLLCSQGTMNGWFDNENNTLPFWIYICYGVNGGTDVQCYVDDDVDNGACGSTNGTSIPVGLSPANTTLLSPCGRWMQAPTNLALNGNTWTWTCDGIGAGLSSGTCSATVDTGSSYGLCGPDNTGTFGSLSPTDPNLCSTGTAAGFTTYPTTWTWTCTGSGPNAVSSGCIAGSVLAQNGACGIDNGMNFTAANPLTSSDPNLCSVGGSMFFTAQTALHPVQYSWSCGGTGVGASTVGCTATGDNGTANGVCGTANGYPSLTAPTTGLCTTGTWTAVQADSTNTNWLWTCQGVLGGANMNCTAPISSSFSNGVCGTTSGTAVPNTPNFNLCNSGVASPVSGVGPWTWTCLGTGGGTDSSQCAASLCLPCTGTITSSHTAAQSETGACTASGTASWNEVDTLIAGSGASGTISWTDDMGNFSQSVSSAVAPTYCQACSTQLQSVNNVSVTVDHANASCPFNKHDVLPASNISATVP